MSDKFKYAPGKPGIGSKGEDGKPGNPGLSMYFTDFNPITQKGLINDRIENNQALWSEFLPPVSLPSGRKYVTGDLFFDQDGQAYEINAETNTFEYKFASLNMGGFFIPLNVSSSDNFQRYFNSNVSPKYIIDNVYTESGAIDYTQSPTDIYGILPKNFTRLEYTNVKWNGYNPFTVYSSGETNDQSLALVYDGSTATFHLGNLDIDGKLRNTNLIFDVSLLKHTKQSGNLFTVNTPDGAILTNAEIAANSLFAPNFNRLPDSFSAIFGGSDVSIYWTLSDFTNDPDVDGDLYFFEKINPDGSIFKIDSSMLRPLIFSNVPETGSVKITGCSSTRIYSCYMKLYKNGWARTSEALQLFSGTLSVTPLSFVLNSSDAGTVGFDIDANYPWTASFTQNPESFMSVDTSTIGAYDGSLSIDFTVNASTRARLGEIRVQLEGSNIYKDVSIWQPRGVIGPELFLYSPAGSTANFSYATWPYYTLNASFNGYIKGSSSLTINVSTNSSWATSNVPSWVTLAPSFGTGTTSVLVTVNENLSLQGRSQTMYFNYGDTPVQLSIYQEAVQAWLEYGGTRYDQPTLTYNHNGGIGSFWQIDWGTPLYGNNLYMNMKFSDGASIDWQWDNTSLSSWLDMTDRSGTGDYYGPSFSYNGYGFVSGMEWIDGSAGGIYGYPLRLMVEGFN